MAPVAPPPPGLSPDDDRLARYLKCQSKTYLARVHVRLHTPKASYRNTRQRKRAVDPYQLVAAIGGLPLRCARRGPQPRVRVTDHHAGDSLISLSDRSCMGDEHRHLPIQGCGEKPLHLDGRRNRTSELCDITNALFSNYTISGSQREEYCTPCYLIEIGPCRAFLITKHSPN